MFGSQACKDKIRESTVKNINTMVSIVCVLGLLLLFTIWFTWRAYLLWGRVADADDMDDIIDEMEAEDETDNPLAGGDKKGSVAGRVNKIEEADEIDT